MYILQKYMRAFQNLEKDLENCHPRPNPTNLEQPVMEEGVLGELGIERGCSGYLENGTRPNCVSQGIN